MFDLDRRESVSFGGDFRRPESARLWPRVLLSAPLWSPALVRSVERRPRPSARSTTHHAAAAAVRPPVPAPPTRLRRHRHLWRHLSAAVAECTRRGAAPGAAARRAAERTTFASGSVCLTGDIIAQRCRRHREQRLPAQN